MEKTDAEIKSFCWKNGVTIYPVFERNKWFICAESSKKKTIYRTNPLSTLPIFRMKEEHVERMMNCYRHWYKKIKGNV